MPVVAASFAEFVLGIHILAVVVSFGVLFLYPVLGRIGARMEPAAMPSFLRFQQAVHVRVSAPGLVVLLLAGIYLATDGHQWSKFYVAWGLLAVIVIGGVGGAYIAPRERRLIELADRELAAVPAGGVAGTWSPEYLALSRQADRARSVQMGIATLTIFFMALHLGA